MSEIRIRYVMQGEREFGYDGEDADAIRDAILERDDANAVPDLYDVTDTDRSRATPDEHLTVTEDGGRVLWAGWLGGVRKPAPGTAGDGQGDLVTANEQLGEALTGARAANERWAATLVTVKRQHAILKSALQRIALGHKITSVAQVSVIADKALTDASGIAGGLDVPAPVLVTWDPRECTTTHIGEIAEAVEEQSGGRVIITMTDIADSDCHAVIGPREYTDDEALELIEAGLDYEDEAVTAALGAADDDREVCAPGDQDHDWPGPKGPF